MSDQPVEVLVARLGDTEVSLADFVDAAVFKEGGNGVPKTTSSALRSQAMSPGDRQTHASLSTMNEQSECSRVV